MKIKNSLLVFLAILVSVFVTAQEKNKQKEVGLIFNSVNSFGLSMKSGSSKSLWRINTLLISGSRNVNDGPDSLMSETNHLGFNVRFGKEYRRIIDGNLELRFGADLSFSYRHNKSVSKTGVRNYVSESNLYSPGINLVFGLNYVFNKEFVIGAELSPHFTYFTYTFRRNVNGRTQKGDRSGISYGLSNSSALISLSYRF